MKYAMIINDNAVSIEISGALGKEDLLLVKEMLTKAIDNRIGEIEKAENNKLPITADIDAMCPALTMRTRNVLKRAGINTIKDVLDRTPTELQKIRNMGRKSYEEIKERFSKYGQLKEDQA